ncbi:hypothetical protein SAMN05421810_10255 [Amycolatopsis arida]|uniref:Transmembrane secretion effector n=1 Tax=Amycolatopsis arida TaxID=587909 RepID=A0A1I5NWA7_9PSEU|nr:hypothetical protein [Amycolatopsis arida]TDX98266.1 hypothetical protein CLV69_10155 [Amycolatopsis arida]SFP26064.1 hypothetical protein SAMN05421810_10255 [Amycolatopsis arida]
MGAGLITLGGAALVAVGNAVSFLVSAVVLVWIRRGHRHSTADAADAADAADGSPPAEATAARAPRGLLGQLTEGLTHVARHPLLRVLVLADLLVELALAGPVNIGLVLVSDGMGGGPTGAGLLLTAFTVGTTASFLLSLAWPVRRPAGAMLVASTAALGAVFGALALTVPDDPTAVTGGTALPVALGGYALLGALGAQCGLVLVSLLQRAAAPEVRGRVMSVFALMSFGAVPLGNLLSGLLVGRLGTAAMLGVHAGLAAVAAGTVLAAPGLRRATLA